MNLNIPLLSGKSLSEFTPDEFLSYIQSLLNRPVKKQKTIKLKAAKKEIIYKLTAKGNLSVSIKRKPKWISLEEIGQISKETGVPLNEVWIKLVTKGKTPISTKEEQLGIAQLETQTVVPR